MRGKRTAAVVSSLPVDSRRVASVVASFSWWVVPATGSSAWGRRRRRRTKGRSPEVWRGDEELLKRKGRMRERGKGGHDELDQKEIEEEKKILRMKRRRKEGEKNEEDTNSEDALEDAGLLVVDLGGFLGDVRHGRREMIEIGRGEDKKE